MIKAGKRYKYADADTNLGHTTWARLVVRQKKEIASVVCAEFAPGYKRLALDPHYLPDMKATSRHLKKMSGWTLADAENRNLSMADWFPHMLKRSFPVTSYIRRPENIDFAPQPDLFHEYFGHLAFLTNREIGDLVHKFGVIARHANRRQLSEITRLWWFSMEAGLIKQNGKIKVFGAAIISSWGECEHAKKLIRSKKVKPFTIDEVIKTRPTNKNYHKVYFYVESFKHLSNIIDEYARRESLKV